MSIVQGLTEFLPVSSSGHLRIVSELFWGNDAGASFTAVIQLGTELAVLVYFAPMIWQILSGWFRGWADKSSRGQDWRMGWMVIVGSIPIGIIGFAFEDAIRGALRNLWITATMLLVFALVIMLADVVSDKRVEEGHHEKGLDELTWADGVKYGFFQALALIPGVSRSGGTVAGGLFMGYSRPAAARYSFLLAIPAVLSSGLLELMDVISKGKDHDSGSWGMIAIATLLAFGVGYAVISWFMRYISTHNFRPFVIYRIALALVVFGLLATGTIDAAVN